MAQAVTQTIDGAEVLDLYEQYPDFDIDVKAEQDRLRQAQTTSCNAMYWYATPALLKEWVDLSEHGFAYGKDSEELAGKYSPSHQLR